MKYDISGVSTPVGGLSWDKSAAGKEMFTRLFLDLESKRILVNPKDMEKKEWCIDSVLEMKANIVSITEGIALKAFDLHVLRSMIDACNRYLDEVSPLSLPVIIFKDGDNWEDLCFDNAMKQLRDTFREEIRKVEQKYKLQFTKDIPEKY